MISFKAIRPPFFTLNYGGPFPEKETFRTKRKLILSLCTSNNSDEQNPPPKGDTHKQQLLARIATLQTQKLSVTEYVDEASSYLTQFAEEANAEIDQIGENALRELDEAGARIMGNIENEMQAFEESMELEKMENEENEKKVADLEGQIGKDRKRWLFFKRLGEKTLLDKKKAKEEAEKIRELTGKSAGSLMRRNIYLVLIGLVVVGIADETVSFTYDWRKIVLLGFILVGLISQLVSGTSSNFKYHAIYLVVIPAIDITTNTNITAYDMVEMKSNEFGSAPQERKYYDIPNGSGKRIT